MVKRSIKTLIFALLSLCVLCAAIMIVAGTPTAAKAAEGTDEPAARILVLDKIEDFRTCDNGDGTYTILGLNMDDDFVKNSGSFMSVLEPSIWSYDAAKTGISAVGLRKILGLADGDNAGLTKADGESDSDFEQRVYAALFAKFLQGDVGENGYTQFKIVIPHNVSEIQDFAFLSGFMAAGTAGGTRNVRMPYGYNNKAYVSAFLGQEKLADVDFVAELSKYFMGEESDLTEEELETLVEMAQMGIGIGAVEIDPDTGAFTETSPRNMPSLVDFSYGKDGEGKRSLKTMGAAVLGIGYMESLTLPVDIDVSYAYGLKSKDITIREDGKDKNVSVATIVQYEQMYIEDGVTEIPDSMSLGNNYLKSVVVPASVEYVGQYALSGPIEEITILGDCVKFHATAFGSGSYGNGTTRNVKINSLEQWFSFDFGGRGANPLYSSGNDSSKLFVSDGNGGYTEVKTLVVPATRKVKNEETGEITIEPVTAIPDWAFTSCVSFTSLNFQSNITAIGEGAFWGCSNLQSVNMDSVTSIGAQAFAWSGLTSVRIPDGVSVLEGGWNGAGIFSVCKSLKEVIFSNGDNLVELGASTFASCTALESIVIPASVQKIGYQCFQTCTALKSLTFAGKNVKEIDGRAFLGCSALESLVLPEGLTTVGECFVDGCGKMGELVLPSSVTTIDDEAFAGNIGESSSDPNESNFVVRVNGMVETVGKDLFGRFTGPISARAKYGVIYAANKAIYDNFLQKAEGKTSRRMIVTYPVQLRYVYDGITLASEIHEYNYEVPETLALNGMSAEWFSDAEFTQSVTAANVLGALSADTENAALIDENGVITLYAKQIDGPIFVGRSDLIYNGESYSGVGINELLTDESININSDMTVTVKSYTDALGNTVAPVPAEICDAGTYTVAVGVDGKEHEFEIHIARRALDISALDWRVSSIDADASGESFVGSRLYLYIDAQNSGKTYASLDYLDMSVEEIRNRYSLYAMVSMAANSITRYRDGAEITVGLDIAAFPEDAFSVEYSGTTVAADYGMYDASAVIAPSVNYTYFVTDTTGFNASGRAMAARADGGYVITKTWYIAGMANWLVDEDDGQYAFGGSFGFGDGAEFTAPFVKHGDVASAQYGTASDPLTLKLYIGNAVIGSFHRGNYAEYINAAMPAGKYTLEITVLDVLYEGSTIDGFTRSYEFTVTAAALPKDALDALNKALKNNTFEFDYDGAMHLFDAAAKSAIEALQTATAEAQPDRAGTVWANNEFDAYYGGFTIKFNLDRMRSVAYFTENDLNGEEFKPVAPDKYIVYYAIAASNFESLVNDALSTADYDAARRQYVFYTVIVREVEIPIASNAVYNGTNIKADIASSEFYTVNDYDGFTSAGAHEVKLTLVNPEYYRWKGQSLGTAEISVRFEIIKAANEWLEAPDVVRWVEGKFNEEENGFIGAAKFGTISYVVTDTEDNVIYDLSQNIDKRADMKAGTYILKATVAGNGDYNGLSEAFTVRILEKVGLPWWATTLIAVGALMVAAIIILILWKKGVFQILTGKIVLAIRTRATIDATIAAVRAAKRSEQAKRSVAEAETRDAAEARAQARKEAAEAERQKPIEERAAVLESKAQETSERADRMKARADKMKARVERMKKQAQMPEAAATETPEATENTDDKPEE